MHYHAITLFPEMFDSYMNESILLRAREKGLISFDSYNPREFAVGKHKTVDDIPYGGGPGMVLMAMPFLDSCEKIIESIPKQRKKKIILFSPSAKQFSNIDAKNWSENYDDIIFLCGRYEGVDARVEEALRDTYSDDEIEVVSVGPYVLTGGEIPALTIIDAVSRHIPGVLGNNESPEELRSASHKVYTRPDVFTWNGKEYTVPEVLRSGNHADIEAWRKEN